jgi:urease accessory protein
MSVVPAAKDIFAANRAFGQIALAVKASGGTTRRAHVREEGPLRVRCPGPASPELQAVIVNTSGGIVGGDCCKIDVAVETGARLVITTAAAEKIYRSLGPDASMDVKLKVGAGASLAWLPQETIVFDGARLARRVDIELAANAHLVFAEAIVFGRSGMGESVRDGRVSDRWLLRRQGQLIHAESLRLEGGIAATLSQAAVAKGAPAIATVLISPADETIADGLRALANTFRGEIATSAWKGMAVVRLCAADGAALRHDLIAILSNVSGAPLPRLWLN